MIDPAWASRVRGSPSPLLRRQLAEAGLEPSRLQLEEVSRLPRLLPRDLDLDRLADPVGWLRLGDAAPPIRLGSCEREGATIVLTWTAADLARIAETGARALAAAGVTPGMKVANTLEGGFETPGSLVLGDALEKLGALDVPLGPVRDEKTARSVAELLDRIAADVLVLDGRSASGLLAALAETPPSGWPRGWRGTLWLGLDPLPRALPGWRRRWLSVPEVSVFLAVECHRGALHLDPNVLVEIRDRHALMSSTAGDAPLFAYDAGLEARAVRSGCSCGDARPLIEL